MPDVKVCLWNVQNYGQHSGKYNGGGFATSNALRNRFISQFVRHHDIDVLMIQEVQTSAENALDNLKVQLNALYPGGPAHRDWAYSWCGSAIVNHHVDNVTQEADLTDRTGARSECYGVLWRQRQGARFAMIRALHQIAHGTGGATAISPLNISQYGRPTGNFQDAWGRDKYGATGGFTLAHPYPYELDPVSGNYDLLDHWPKLNYPPTSNGDVIGVRWWGARRPAYVTVKLSDANNNLCPVGVYHAPSNRQRAEWGAYMAGLAREVYVVDDVTPANAPIENDPVVAARALFGGDFNLSVDGGDWPGDYRYFTAARRTSTEGGAARAVVPPGNAADELRRSTVQIVEGIFHNVPITGANTSDYFRYKIDLGFYPGGVGMTAERVDLLDEVMNNPGNIYDGCLVATEAYMADVQAQIANPFNYWPQRLAATGPQEQVTRTDRRGRKTTSWVPLISGAWGGTFTDWAETRRQFAAHDIADARRAAEFMHIFISDHLPLVVTIPV